MRPGCEGWRTARAALALACCQVSAASASVVHAGAPGRLAIAEPGSSWLLLSWDPAVGAGDCTFVSWRLELRPDGAGGAWAVPPECSALNNRSDTSCNATDLQENAQYEARVTETCSNPLANSAAAYAELPLWTLPGEWEVYLGKSNVASVQVDVGQAPHSCSVVKACCDDEFSLCYGPFQDELLTVTRTDTPEGWERQVGWGQEIKLRCTALSLAPWAAQAVTVPAAAPDSLSVFEPTESGLRAWFYYSSSIGDCECAVPRLQVRAIGSAGWFSVGSTCADASYRFCIVSGLAADTRYEARVQVACSDEALSSSFTYAPGETITLPACKWQTDSGRELEFECIDGSFCNMTEPSEADFNETCCNEHGGRLRCPKSLPVMCQDQVCADFQDHCCATDCSQHGGPRLCTPASAPAKEPVLLEFVSLAPAALTLRWSRGRYLSYVISPCIFQSWHVEVARAYTGVMGPWVFATECTSVGGHDLTEAFSCNVSGLISMTAYYMRVKETCTDNSLSSEFLETAEAATTRPWTATMPPSLQCRDMTDDGFLTEWSVGMPVECTFLAWEVTLRVMPRPASYSAEGKFEPYAQGSDWMAGCTTHSRDHTSCQTSGLLSDRDYEIRVHESCTDQHANSPFRVYSLLCHTVAIPARPVENITVADAGVYYFELEWTPGDPRACVFDFWEVQAKAIDEESWPNSSDLSNVSDFSCIIGQRAVTACTVSVGLGSSTYYDVRVRENCTDSSWISEWAYIASPALTAAPVRADTVMNLTNVASWPNLLTLEWIIGAPGACVFTFWLVEVLPHGAGAAAWARQQECASAPFPRAAARCNITAGLAFDAGYDVRVREDCTDANARSPIAVWPVQTRPMMRAEAPKILLVSFPTPFSLRLRWSAGHHYDCDFVSWGVQLQPVGQADEAAWGAGVAECRQAGERAKSECLITGLRSGTEHELRVWESCTLSSLNSPYESMLITTPLAPATKPLTVELPSLTENSVAVRFLGATVGDCLDAAPEVQVIPRGGTQFTTAPISCAGVSTVAAPHDTLEATCTAYGLLPDTLYFVRVRLKCPVESLNSNFTLAPAPKPTLPGCKWSIHSGRQDEFECADASYCSASGDSCCNSRGGRQRCPAAAPVMCANDLECADSQDHCCSTDCTPHGGPRSCGPAQWPAKVPEILLNASLSPASLTLNWFAPGYLSGHTSQCVFLRWSVQYARVHADGLGAWESAHGCEGYARWFPSCVISGLVFLTPYVMRVAEVCTDPNLSSLYNVTEPITTRGELAGTPANISVVAQDQQSLMLSWDPAKTGDCVFRAWLVEWRQEFPTSEWTVASECSTLGTRAAPQCSITGLQSPQAYQVRVRELCIDARTDSPWGYTPGFRWDRPGEWSVYLGPSQSMSMEVNALAEAHRCSVVKQCCDDEFSVCLSEALTERHLATIVRTDALAGWGQQLWLSCVAPALAAGLDAEVAAAAPEALRLLEPTRAGMQAQFSLGRGVGDCTCAAPRLQVRAEESSTWTTAAGTCGDIARRACAFDGLEPDTLYHGRLQVACADEALSSLHTTGLEAVATLPGCWWWTDSGRDSEFECADGTFCGLQDDECCNSHGGRLRCPPNLPVMCSHENDCAGGQDHCCATDCTPHGGPRPCTDDAVPAKAPSILELSSPTPSSLTLRWAPGTYLSARVSQCQFAGWSVEMARVHSTGRGAWQHVPACEQHGSEHAPAPCTIEGLESASAYDVRLAEMCVQRNLNSLHTVSAVPGVTLPQPAGIPANVSIVEFGLEGPTITWEPSDAPSNCTFRAWVVEYQVWNSSSDAWASAAGCASLTTRQSPRCTVTGLQAGSSHVLRVSEACSDPQADGPPALTAPFSWEQPEVWKVFVGASAAAEVELDVLQTPSSCDVSPSAAGDFSLCYGQPHRQLLRLSRTDSPGGWSQGFWLTCTSAPGNAGDGGAAAAAQPTLLEFSEATYATVRASFTAGAGLGTGCDCAALRLQVLANNTSEWLAAGSGCADWARRECTVEGLQPDTIYQGRLQVGCADEALSSAFQYAAAPFATLPPCKWLAHSGRLEEYECKDGTFCSTANSTCCNDHGGRLRCPQATPVMCYNDRDCAGNADHCCETDCSAHGGPRPCTAVEVPAKVPAISSVVSLAAASLTISWTAGEYSAGFSSRCQFLRWSVELSRVHASGRDAWQADSGCADLDRWITTCSVGGLASEAEYDVRISEVCTEPDLNSAYATAGALATTRPLPALPPHSLSCIGSSRGGQGMQLQVSWLPGLGRDCLFSRWELEVGLLEGDGQPASWAHGCDVHLRPEVGSCSVEGLLSGRRYAVRVRELCTQLHADSSYDSEGLTCATEALPADPVENLQPRSPSEAYALRVQWDAGLPWACTFAAWEVQAKTVDSAWPAADSGSSGGDAFFRCRVADRGNCSCRLPVVRSGTSYDVRVRETCTDAALSSAWDYVDLGMRTLLPVRAGAPERVTVEMPSPFEFTISWVAGTPGDCVFVAWLVELSGSTATDPDWQEVTECASLPRGPDVARCTVSMSRLTGTSNDLQIRETCTDANAWSNGAVVAGAVSLSPAGSPPGQTSLLAVGHTWLQLSWSQGAASSQCQPSWMVEWAAQPGGDGAPANGTAVCPSTTCNITGLMRNTPHTLRVTEACSSPVSLGASVTHTLDVWTLPAQWEVFIGSSDAVSVEVDVVREPHRCHLVKECCTDEFTVCQSTLDAMRFTVSRMDTPGGWGQEVKLRCTAPSQADFVSPPHLQASGPSSLLLFDPTTDTFRARFPRALGAGLGDCACARPRLEIRAESASDWQAVGGNCTDLARRECLVTGLEQDTRYVGRVQVECAKAELSSSFTYADATVGTILPIAVAAGSLEVEELAEGSRRLAATDNLVQGTRAVVSDMAGVPLSAVYVQLVSGNASAGPGTPTHVLVSYSAAAAVAGKSLSHDAALALAADAASLLDARSPQDSSASELALRLEAALTGQPTVRVATRPHAELRVQAFPACSPPAPMAGASSEWSPSACAGRTWSDEPCEVPCAPGFQAQGVGFRCGATGEWEGEPPQCASEWAAGPWSVCSGACGETGMQRRWVACPQGEVCSSDVPEGEQACRSTEGCAWVSQDWGSCSAACGQGRKSRLVACSSGSDGDCSSERPPEQAECQGYSGCSWQTTAWGDCSSSCGTGTQSRAAQCPSGNPSHCGALLPATVRLCRNTSGCAWQAAEWSQCSSICGKGSVQREVWCPSGNSSDCGAGEPPASEECYSTASCAWVPEPWSACSNGCGAGVQSRAVGCPSGHGPDCPTEAPAASQPCYGTYTCSWIASEWGQCSNLCGSGTRLREVACASGRDVDCPAGRPMTQEACHATVGCAWDVGPWGACSSSCGTGEQFRVVFCPSGDFSDCGQVQPAVSQQCRNTTACSWRSTEWSECSSSCGSGQTLRNVSCSSGVDSDCSAQKPAKSGLCHRLDGCGWTISPWSACNSTCGAGHQSRSASCPTADAPACQEAGPSTLQSCHATSGCHWLLGNWGACSNGCGSGSRYRPVECPSGSDADCPGNRPRESEACYATVGCQWQLTDWGSCSAPACGDGLRARTTWCPSGSAVDCGAPSAATELCRNITGCSWRAGEWSECSSSCGDGESSRSVLCSGAVPTDCLDERPPSQRPCRATHNCSWQLELWSPCSTSCGQGVQSRSVSCPSGSAGDCPGAEPPDQQPCYAMSGCAWTVSDWGDCSHACGPGVRLREANCSSGSTADCAHVERPLDRQDCGLGTGNCNWTAGAWGACSATLCGSRGTRLREVTCPSAEGIAGCHAVRPIAVEECLASTACSWRVSEWSSCQSECGWGTQVRSVSCQGVSEDGCSGPRPADSRECYGSAGCRWWLSSWSECNSTCGEGVQLREVVCDGECEGPGPSSSRACHRASSCTWAPGDWADCSVDCGAGVQLRSVVCTGGADEDCLGSARPPERRECHATSGCLWTTGAWSICSAACGAGTEQRTVACTSGHEADCEQAARPSATRPCTEAQGCSWRTAAWSACSASCGTGLRSRDVRCTGTDAASCEGEGPESSQPCTSEDGCGWAVGSWSGCNVLCRQGVQQRNVSCQRDDASECQSGPPTWQYCYADSGCEWLAFDWGACSDPCGLGTRTRDVRCTGASASLCRQTKPVDVEPCNGTVGCEWRVSHWSECNDTCGPETRQVRCLAAHAGGCLGEAPVAARACSAANCTRNTSAVARFSLALQLPEPVSEAMQAEVLESARIAVADVLEVPLSSVRVWIVPRGGSADIADAVGGVGRRLGTLLQLLAEVARLATGQLRLLASPAGHSLLSRRLGQELAPRGINASGLSLVVDPSTEGPAEPPAGPEAPGRTRSSDGAVGGTVAAITVTVAAASMSLAGLLACRSCMQRGKYAKQVAPETTKVMVAAAVPNELQAGSVALEVQSKLEALQARPQSKIASSGGLAAARQGAPPPAAPASTVRAPHRPAPQLPEQPQVPPVSARLPRGRSQSGH